jgi:phosphoribosylformimino-5-aminoimidazole carboxamide ribonucleotide (ProFAR) isomerase
VQLVQGREKALEGPDALEMLERFAGFPEIQVIDLDAAMGVGENFAIIEMLASRATCRVGGGVRTPQRARQLVDLGAHQVIVGTATFTPVFDDIVSEIGKHNITVALDSKNGKVVVDGWKTSLTTTADQAIESFSGRCSGYLCTYVDKEGMMEGTDLAWFASLRERTTLPITAAGGITTLQDIRDLFELQIDAAIGMAVYTGRISLDDLRNLTV